MQTVIAYLKETWKPLLFNGLILWVSTYIFFELAGDVWERETLVWDTTVALGVHQLSSPFLDTVMTAITWTGFQLVIPLTIGLMGWFWWLKQRRLALFLLLSVAGTALTSGILKVVFQRVRPTIFTPLHIETSYSFPSGHTLTAVGFYGFIAILLWRSSGLRGWALFSALWAGLIGLSRIYLGVHYPSDVLASFAIGAIWLVIVSYQYARPPNLMSPSP